jgi:hypothetical protein
MGGPSPEKGRGDRHQLQIDTTQNRRETLMRQAVLCSSFGKLRTEVEQRINSAVEIIEAGTKKSSGIAVTTTPSTVVTTLNAFTIVDWTSLSRSITNKYTLVFDLREGDTEISRDEAKEAWHQILEKTLNPDDLEKLHPDD